LQDEFHFFIAFNPITEQSAGEKKIQVADEIKNNSQKKAKDVSKRTQCPSVSG